MKKKKSVKMGIIVAILLLAVGFAAVTTQLIIRGVAIIKPDDENFRKYVVFSELEGKEAYITVSGIDKSADEITATVSVENNGKLLTFTAPVLNEIGQEVTIHYNITNKSEYNARLGKVVCEILNEDGTSLTAGDEYISVTEANTHENKLLKSGATTDKEDTVTFKMVKSYSGEENKNYQAKCEMIVKGEEITNS